MCIQYRSHGDQSDPPLLEDNEMLEAVRRKEIGSNEEEETEIMESTSCKDHTEKDIENREENHFEDVEKTEENASNDNFHILLLTVSLTSILLCVHVKFVHC